MHRLITRLRVLPKPRTVRNMASTVSPTRTANSSLGQSLQFITKIKLQEVEKQRALFEEHAKAVEEASTFAEKGDILKKVEVLAKAVKSWTGSGALDSSKTVGGSLNLHDLDFWLIQARKDPSFSNEVAERWASILEEHIQHLATRLDAAKLFGNLFNEWLASGDSIAVSGELDVDSVLDDGKPKEAGFEEVGRKEMHEQKEKLQSIIFEEADVDIKQLKKYLKELFEPEEAAKALLTVRRDLKKFGRDLRRKTVSSSDVRNAIQGLLSSDMTDEQKISTLKAFTENQAVLDEVASVLTMRMASLDTWHWPVEGMEVEFRRHLNGKYRAFTDPEIIDALLLHHIGVAWQVKFKESLLNLFRSKAWVRPLPPTAAAKERRRNQLPDEDPDESIDKERQSIFEQDFFLAQLQDSAVVTKSYDGGNNAYNHGNIKQKLLQIMTTECYLNTTLYDTHAAVCSDFAWFGPSLPHASILTVLEFLGMPKDWLDFYSAFLSAPIRFQGDAEPRVRRRGTPIDYSLSAVCGELVIFIMDFAVNQRANGLQLYRMHDDLWLWNADVVKVAAGWTEMQRYATLVGLEFNTEKTGAAYIGPENPASSALPAGAIRWGFLKFDTASRRFRLNQDEVDQHIAEMRRQLAATKSVFGWANLYNKYMAFFFRNFGGAPPRCFGPAHVDELVDTLARIQRALFPTASEHGGDGGAVGHLRRILEERFGVTGLPEGYFYFPIASGGLGLRNMMIELLALEKSGNAIATRDEAARDSDDDDSASDVFEDDVSDSDSHDSSGCDCWIPPKAIHPAKNAFQEAKAVADQKFVKRMQADTDAYTQAKERWEQDDKHLFSVSPRCSREDEFMSFEAYATLRESWLSTWGDSYRDMLEAPEYRNVSALPKVTSAASGAMTWSSMGWYDRWVLSMYGEGVIRKYGSVKAVDPALIPVGMVELFRTAKIKLDQ